MWKNTVKKACSACAGPGGIFCTWVGRNCNYNDCPRRSLEEIYVRPVDDKLEIIVEELRTKVADLEKQLEFQVQRRLEAAGVPQEENENAVMEELKKIENA